MEQERVHQVADDMVVVVERLQRDIREKSDSKSIYSDIHTLRSSLNRLEREMRGSAEAVKSDAC